MTVRALLVAAVALVAAAAPPAPAHACPAWLVLGSRGSSEPLHRGAGLGGPVGAFARAVERGAGGAAHVALVANPYPARGIGAPWRRLFGATAAGRDGPLLAGYRASVQRGEELLDALLQDWLARCGGRTHVLLAGYSQGAQVTADVVQQLDRRQRDQLAGVVLFGDTRRNGDDPVADAVSGAPTGRGGVLGWRPRFPPDLRGRILSYCHAGDPFCNHPPTDAGFPRFRLRPHLTYARGSEPLEAARYLVALVGSSTAP